MSRLQFRDPMARPRLWALGALVSIGALLLIGTLAGQSGHGGRAATVQVPRKVAPAVHETVPNPGDPAEVADHFATAFESGSWQDPPSALAARTAPWAAQSLIAALAAPDGGGPPASVVASRSVTSAAVLSTSIDRAGPAADLALVSLRLTTVPAGAAARTSTVMLPLSLVEVGGRWVVDAVPGLVR
jgi:hypothetical protein